MKAVSRLRAYVVFLAAVLCAGRAAAQTYEVASGYVIGRYSEIDTTLIGWSATLAAKPSAKAGRLFIVCELSGDYDTTSENTRRQRPMTFAFLDGPRVVLGEGERVRLFGEALIGIMRDEGFPEKPAGRNHFAAQPGIGIDVHLSSHVSVRFQGTLRFAVDSGDRLALWRALSTLVFATRR